VRTVRLDINCDLGEGFGIHHRGEDQALLRIVSSANIACGFHAGDPATMRRTVAGAVARGVAVGAHVSYPDLVGFGRRRLAATPVQVADDVLYQLGALEAFCRAEGTRVRHVKPHGALYNVAVDDKAIAAAICGAIARFDRSLSVYALGDSELARAAAEAGLRVAAELFADRAVDSRGRLVPRSDPRAMITDPGEAAARIARCLATGRLTSVDGVEVGVRVDTVCVHGDTPGAVGIAAGLRRRLEEAGLTIAPPVPEEVSEAG